MPKTETTPENKKMDGNQKFWLLFWVLILGSCTIEDVAHSFSNSSVPLVLLKTGCDK